METRHGSGCEITADYDGIAPGKQADIGRDRVLLARPANHRNDNAVGMAIAKHWKDKDRSWQLAHSFS